MGYIEIPKIWKRKFSKEKIESIWEMFKSLCSNVNWDNTMYVDYFRTHPIVHPETDVEDDTEGIKPKQLISLMEVLSLDEIKKLFQQISNNGATYRRTPFYEDGYISWKMVFDDYVKPILEKENCKKEFQKLIIMNDTSKPSDFEYYKYKDEVFEAISSGEISWIDFQALLSQKPYPKGEVISLKKLSMDEFWNKREEAWKKIHNFAPKAKEVLALNPQFWDRKAFVDSLEYHYKTKNIAELNEKDKEQFLSSYKIFGSNIAFINNFLKERKTLENGKISMAKNIELYDKQNGPSKAFGRIVSESRKGLELGLTVENYIDVLTTLTLFQSAEDEINNKDRLTLKDIETLYEGAEFARKLYIKGDIKNLEKMDYKLMSTLNKYNLNEHDKQKVIELFNATCHLETEVPLAEGTNDGYTWEMIPKSDIRGLIAGNATNCCQRIGGVGSTCVTYGATKKNSAFFIISKNNRIVAQSWVWMKKDQLTFDNIETLGDVRDAVVGCYKEYAKFAYGLKRKDIQKITVGAGHSDVSLSKYFEKADDYVEVGGGVYSDASTQYLIKKPKK